MSASQPFCPHYTSGQTVVAAAASASITFGAGEKCFRVCNLGANVAYIRVGTVGTAATVADLCVPSGAVEVLTKDENHNTLAYISPLGATLNLIAGEGW